MGNQGVCALYEEEQAITNPKPFVPNKQVKRSGDIIYYDDDSWYKGGIKDGEPHGDGTYTRPDKTFYYGQWNNGLPHGYGKEMMEGMFCLHLLETLFELGILSINLCRRRQLRRRVS